MLPRRDYSLIDFYLVPLKSLAEEKFLEFKTKYEQWGLQIAISTADRTENDDRLLEYEIIIATYEKLYSLIVRFQSLVNEIGVVIIDEVQNIGDELRGAGLEVLLTLLMNSSRRKSPQLIALSAMVPEPTELANWLGASLVTSVKRTVDLHEGVQYVGMDSFTFREIPIKTGSFLYREYNSAKINSQVLAPMNLPSSFASLAKSEQIIVFASWRETAEEIARLLANEINVAGNVGEWIEELDSKVEVTPSTNSLRTCMLRGIAFHHAGLVRGTEYSPKGL